MARKRRSNSPRRSEVTEKVEHQQDSMDQKNEELDTIATDTETVRDTLEALEFDGTAEGSDDVEEAIEKSEDVTVEIFEHEDENLEEIQSDTEEYEGELHERSDSSESDLDKISDAAAKIETRDTVDELAHAKEAVSSDIEFISEQERLAKDARDESEHLQQEHRGRVHSGRR